MLKWKPEPESPEEEVQDTDPENELASGGSAVDGLYCSRIRTVEVEEAEVEEAEAEEAEADLGESESDIADSDLDSEVGQLPVRQVNRCHFRGY